MSQLDEALAATLRRYLSEIVAESLRSRAMAAARIPDGELYPEQIPLVALHLEAGVRLFVEPSLQPALLRELRALAGGGVLSKERHELRDESDIALVRRRARELAQSLGASAMGVQRLATATSELARNVVAYAGHGFVELTPAEGRRLVTLCVTDAGPGIPHLERVLSGQYRSPTGLGKGLLGVRRIAEHFDVRTSPRGTRVEAAIAL